MKIVGDGLHMFGKVLWTFEGEGIMHVDDECRVGGRSEWGCDAWRGVVWLELEARSRAQVSWDGKRRRVLLELEEAADVSY